MPELRGQTAGEFLDVLFKDHVMRMAFEQDMFALSARGTFQRLLERLDVDAPQVAGTIDIRVPDASTVQVTYTTESDTTMDVVSRQSSGGDDLAQLARYIKRNYYSNTEGQILLDHLVGCRVRYSYHDGYGYLQIEDDTIGDLPYSADSN